MKYFTNILLLVLSIIALFYVDAICLLPVIVYFIVFIIVEFLNQNKKDEIINNKLKEKMFRYGYIFNKRFNYFLKNRNNVSVMIRVFVDKYIFYSIYNNEIMIDININSKYHHKYNFFIEKLTDFIEDETTGKIDHDNMKDFIMEKKNDKIIYIKYIQDLILLLEPNEECYDLYFMKKHNYAKILVSKEIYNEKLNNLLSII